MTQAAQTDLDELREVVAILIEAGATSFKVRKTPALWSKRNKPGKPGLAHD